MGRKTKLTSELTSKICELLEKGMPIKFTCGAVGIDDATFYGWMQKGEKGNKEYLEFFSRVNQSKAKAVEKYLDRLDTYAANGSVYATTWFLERRCPEEFGRRENLNIKSKNENENLNVNANFELQAPEEIEQTILNKLARIRGRRNSSAALEEPEPEGESLP